MEYLVFVYGSLKKGFHNHHILVDGGAKFIAKDSIKGRMHNLGRFPCVVKGDDVIHGEVYSVNRATMARLDMLEGHPHFYRRELAGKGNDYWTYFLPDLTMVAAGKTWPHIPGGEWKTEHVNHV